MTAPEVNLSSSVFLHEMTNVLIEHEMEIVISSPSDGGDQVLDAKTESEVRIHLLFVYS
jgi:hypothetical protein